MPGPRHQTRRRPGSWRQTRAVPLGRRLWIGTFDLAALYRPVTGSYVLEWDLDADGNYDDDGEDLTCYLVDVSYRIGRDQPSPLPGRAQAGRLQMRLNNDDGRFSPDNVSSPLYGTMGPHRKVRLRSVTPHAEDLFTGWTNGEPQPSATIGGHPTATLEAMGPLAQIAEAFISPNATPGDTTLDVFTDLLSGALSEYLGTPDEAGGAYVTVSNWGTVPQRGMIPLRLLEDVEIGFLHERPDGTVLLNSRDFRSTAARATTVQATFSDATGSLLSYDQVDRMPTREHIANRVAVERLELTVAATTDIWNFPGVPVTVGPAPYRHDVNFAATAPPGTFTGTWVTPVVGTDILYTGPAPTVINVVTTAALMTFTVHNLPAETTVLTTVKARGTPSTPPATQEFAIVEDATSQAAYGARDLRVPGALPYSTYDDALTAAETWIERFKDPHTLLAIEFTANRNALSFAQAVQRRLSDRIHVTATGPRTMLGIDQDFHIEAISGRIDFSGRRHRIRFELSGA